ncbi:MAG: hypothetical protein QOI06_1638 [Nocardioidaceae bacterium]|nr:hypothetical protein [Nocardioidaceae bacterium]
MDGRGGGEGRPSSSRGGEEGSQGRGIRDHRDKRPHKRGRHAAAHRRPCRVPQRQRDGQRAVAPCCRTTCRREPTLGPGPGASRPSGDARRTGRPAARRTAAGRRVGRLCRCAVRTHVPGALGARRPDTSVTGSPRAGAQAEWPAPRQQPVLVDPGDAALPPPRPGSGGARRPRGPRHRPAGRPSCSPEHRDPRRAAPQPGHDAQAVERRRCSGDAWPWGSRRTGRQARRARRSSHRSADEGWRRTAFSRRFLGRRPADDQWPSGTRSRRPRYDAGRLRAAERPLPAWSQVEAGPSPGVRADAGARGRRRPGPQG